VPNKVTGDLKAMILGALAGAGGQEYLQRQADQSPGAFLTLLGKVLPTQMTGADAGPITISFEWAAATPPIFTPPPQDDEPEA
jgi:hypothetical protein